MNLVIKTTHTTDRELEISLPAFYKDTIGNITEYIAILEPETMVKVWHSPLRTCIANETTEGQDKEISRIHKTYALGNEADFFLLFDKAMKTLFLHPVKQYYIGDNGIVAK